jgi:hypothetical protein
MKAEKGSRGTALLFSLTLGLDGGGWSMPCQALANLLPGKGPGNHCTWGCLGPKASLDECRKPQPPPGFNPSTADPPASCYTNYNILAGYLYVHVIWN